MELFVGAAGFEIAANDANEHEFEGICEYDRSRSSEQIETKPPLPGDANAVVNASDAKCLSADDRRHLLAAEQWHRSALRHLGGALDSERG